MESLALFYGIENARMIPAERVFLDLENPRHEPVSSEGEAIEWLCANDNVYNLAKDIAEIGLNPLELVAVIKKGSNAYFTPEGNRRLCAIRLLNDPDRAPSKLRAKFRKLSDTWTPVKGLFCVEFPSRDEVGVWLSRIHGGTDGGRGRSGWDTVQKTRHTGGKSAQTNKFPLAVMDLAEQKGFISKSDRQGKLSVVQRFLSNPVFRNALGIEKLGDGFSTTFTDQDLDARLGRFFADITKDGGLDTRYNSKDIIKYANQELSAVDISTERTSPRQVSSSSPSKPQKPPKPKDLKAVPFSQELQDAFFAMPSYKLARLYYSVTALRAKDHCPIIYVALWSLVECLTSLDGRNPQTDFVGYLSSSKLSSLGFGSKSKTKSIRDAFENIQKYGNGTKHDGEAAGFNDQQMINDYQVVEKVLLKLAKDLAKAVQN